MDTTAKERGAKGGKARADSLTSQNGGKSGARRITELMEGISEKGIDVRGLIARANSLHSAAWRQPCRWLRSDDPAGPVRCAYRCAAAGQVRQAPRTFGQACGGPTAWVRNGWHHCPGR